MRPTAEYLRALAEATAHHASSKTYSGKFLRPHAPFIKQLIDEHHVRSVLDYGCGKGEQYNWVSHGETASIPLGRRLVDFWGVPVTFHDPAYAPFQWAPWEVLPEPRFDMTLITHVLGSIPLQDLKGWVMPTIARHTDKVIYIAEKLGEVRKDVFSQPHTMPRWTAMSWRVFVTEQSFLHPQLRYVLSLRSRDAEETTVERWTYQEGMERRRSTRTREATK